MLNRISLNNEVVTSHTLATYFDKLDKALADIHQLLEKKQASAPIFVKEGSRIIHLPQETILYLEGYGDYVKIHRVEGKTLLTQSSLKYFEKYLDAKQFCRVHRSYIVALTQISYIEHKRIRIGNELIPISDSYFSTLMKHLALDTASK